MRFQETTFRPLFGRILSVVIGVLGVASIVVTFFEADLGLTLRTASVVGLVVVLTFAGFWFPGVAVREEAVEVRNVFRPDVRGPSLPREEALANAPKRNAEGFLVPAVLE